MTISVTHSTPADSSFSSTGATAWNADHTLTGVGTIAEQDANNVAITGGNIDGAPLGATTPAAGTFTTLTATGQTSLGGAAGSESLRAAVPGTTGNYWQFSGSSGAIRVDYQGASAGIDGIFVSRGTGAHRFATSTSASNEQMRVAHTASAVNYVQVTGAATTVAPQISAQGSDTNVGFSVSSKGTGQLGFYTNSVNANSRHLDITHTGSVVNRFTLTGSQTGFGVTLGLNGTDTNISQVFQSKGTGAIDLAAGSSGVNISNGGTVTAITRTSGGTGYATAPTVTISAPTTAGGVQATATCTVTAGVVDTTFTITNAGSGYVEQPTVTFSGGGGSGAAAYATVGSRAIIRSLGVTGNGSLDFETPASATNTVPTLRLRDVSIGTSNTGFVQIQNNNGYSSIIAQGPTNAGINLASNGTGSISFNTNSTNETTQLRVAHTASAVNYVQVTGAATGGAINVTAQGSDTNIRANFYSKGTSNVVLGNGAGINFIAGANAGTSANYLTAASNSAGSAPYLAATGSDTNIDLTLTPKGTGNVRFGTYTGTILTPTGYIEIKDSGGTVRRLLVG